MMRYGGGITQRELARRLGLSQALVSRALAGRAEAIGAAPATVARIRKLATACGYQPSAAALTLRGAPTRTLGVVVKDFGDPYLGHFIGDLQRLARLRQYSLVLTGGAAGDLAALGRHAPDGLIVLGSDFEPGGLAPLLARRLPAVRLGQGRRRAGLRQVTMDEGAGLASVVDHLAALGHRQFGFIGTTAAPSRRRAALLRQLMRARGLRAVASALVAPARPAVEAGCDGMRQLLARAAAQRPTAVLASDDELALGALRAAADAGVRIPGDVSLTGVDDIPAAAMAVPALTTLRQPVPEMIRLAFAMLVGERSAPAGTVQVRPELVVRESTGRVPAQKGRR